MTFLSLTRDRFSDHNVQADVFLCTLEMNFLDNLEAELAVNDWIDIIRTLQVTWLAFCIILKSESAFRYTHSMKGRTIPFR